MTHDPRHRANHPAHMHPEWLQREIEEDDRRDRQAALRAAFRLVAQVTAAMAATAAILWIFNHG